MTTKPWLVPITALRRSIGNRRCEERSASAASLGGAELRVAETSVPADAEVVADVELDSLDGGIEVSGRVQAPWVGECRRCLRPVTGTLDAEVRELYRPRRPGEDPEEDEETYPLSGELLDLAPLVRDAILLDLPMAPLCSSSCGGLCPTCGAALDEGPCDCAPVASDPRWDALDVLRGAGDEPGRPRGAAGAG